MNMTAAVTKTSVLRNHVSKHLEALGYVLGDSAFIRGYFPKGSAEKGGRKVIVDPANIPFHLFDRWVADGMELHVNINPVRNDLDGYPSNQDVVAGRCLFYEHDRVDAEGRDYLQTFFPEATFPLNQVKKRVNDPDTYLVPVDVQSLLYTALSLPEPTVQVFTGSKSVHSYWLLSQPIVVGVWKQLQSDLLAYSRGDRQLNKECCTLRLAGSIHPKTGEYARITGGCGSAYSYEQLRGIIPQSERQMSVDEATPITWELFNQAFKFPITEEIPLEECLSRRNRELLRGGFGHGGRSDAGFKLAADLIGTSAFLTAEGQRFSGDPYKLFIDFCQACPPGDGWNQHEWDDIWKSSQRKPRGTSMSPGFIENCVRAWAWNNCPNRKIPSIDRIGRTMPTGAVTDLEIAPDDASDEHKLRVAIANYNTVCDTGNRFQSILMRGAIAREFGLSKREVEELACELHRGQASDLFATADILIDTFSEIEIRYETEESLGIPCGFYDFDAMTQGLQRSDLIIAAGRPSMGKTSWVLNVARNIACFQQLPVAFFSLEMSKEQLVYRLLASESRIEYGRLRSGRIQEYEWHLLGHAICKLSSLPLYINDSPMISVDEIRSKVRRLQAEEGALGAVILDYLQLMGGDNDNRVEKLAKITRLLKGLARELNVPVMALSQLSRGVESRTNKRPMMSDLRDSGAIEQDADVIIMLYRDEYYNPDTPDRGVAELIITKHRNGPIGTVKLLFDKAFTQFRNLARSGGSFG